MSKHNKPLPSPLLKSESSKNSDSKHLIRSPDIRSVRSDLPESVSLDYATTIASGPSISVDEALPYRQYRLGSRSRNETLFENSFYKLPDLPLDRVHIDNDYTQLHLNDHFPAEIGSVESSLRHSTNVFAGNPHKSLKLHHATAFPTVFPKVFPTPQVSSWLQPAMLPPKYGCASDDCRFGFSDMAGWPYPKLTPEQTMELRNWFYLNINHPYPDTETMNMLQRKTGLSDAVISHWLSTVRSHRHTSANSAPTFGIYQSHIQQSENDMPDGNDVAAISKIESSVSPMAQAWSTESFSMHAAKSSSLLTGTTHSAQLGTEGISVQESEFTTTQRRRINPYERVDQLFPTTRKGAPNLPLPAKLRNPSDNNSATRNRTTQAVRSFLTEQIKSFKKHAYREQLGRVLCLSSAGDAVPLKDRVTLFSQVQGCRKLSYNAVPEHESCLIEFEDSEAARKALEAFRGPWSPFSNLKNVHLDFVKRNLAKTELSAGTWWTPEQWKTIATEGTVVTVESSPSGPESHEITSAIQRTSNKPLPSDSMMSKYPDLEVTNPSSLLIAVYSFYALCRQTIELAADASGQQLVFGPSTNETFVNPTHPAANNSCNRTKKRKGKTDIDCEDQDDKISRVGVASKKLKLTESLTTEFPCWWFIKDPVRHNVCRNYCSRKRDLHSSRRHHFEDHWRWGDVQADGVSFETWNAAKHATCDQPNLSSDSRAHRKWERTYQIYFGLKEADLVPQPVCPDVGHIHYRPKRPILYTLPSNHYQPGVDVGHHSSEHQAVSLAADSLNTSETQTSFLGVPIRQSPDLHLFPQTNSEEHGNPYWSGYFAAWNDHYSVASDLVHSTANMGGVAIIMNDYTSRIKGLLQSLYNEPHRLTQDSIMSVLQLVQNFEVDITQASFSSNAFDAETNVADLMVNQSSLVTDPSLQYDDQVVPTTKSTERQIDSMMEMEPSLPSSESQFDGQASISDIICDPGTPTTAEDTNLRINSSDIDDDNDEIINYTSDTENLPMKTPVSSLQYGTSLPDIKDL